MQPQNTRTRRRTAQFIGLIAVLVLFVVAIWIDLTTGLWQQAVILSGIAAGLLTFLLTALFFERWMTGAEHRRWYPVTHLALTDLLHALGDEEHSHFSRGAIVARSIDAAAEHSVVLDAIHRERRAITHALSRWAGFLAASADVQDLMDRIAELALLLDAARDAVLDAETSPTSTDAQRHMDAAVQAANASIAGAVHEIERALAVVAAASR